MILLTYTCIGQRESRVPLQSIAYVLLLFDRDYIKLVLLVLPVPRAREQYLSGIHL